jgi:hypothetical protein
MPVYLDLAAAAGPSGASYATALFSLAGVLAAAVIAGVLKLHADQVARRAEAQRTALAELQEGALDLRTALGAYGDELPRPSDQAERALDVANGRLDLLIQRVDRAQLRTQVEDWRQVAQQFWTEDQSVTATQEETAWKRIQYYTGEELRRLDQFRLLQDGRL